MRGGKRILVMIFMILILLFGFIHLGVGIGVIGKFRFYRDIFGPERGLAGYNIFIGICALVIAIIGLVAAFANRGGLSKIVAFACIALGIFAFISLIAALAINSLAIDYVTTRFDNRMNEYRTNDESRNLVDQIQTDFECCGNNIWLDWSRMTLNETEVLIKTTLTTTTVSTTTITSDSTTKGFGARTTTRAFSTSSTTEDYDNTDDSIGFTTTSSVIRGKRQIPANYGGIGGLPASFRVVLPRSCCVIDSSSTSYANNLYCISNGNATINSFYLTGCSKPLGKYAVGQTLGMAVINSFLVVLALAAIPILFMHANASTDYKPSTSLAQSMTPYQQHTNEPHQYSTTEYHTETTHTNNLLPGSRTYT